MEKEVGIRHGMIKEDLCFSFSPFLCLDLPLFFSFFSSLSFFSLFFSLSFPLPSLLPRIALHAPEATVPTLSAGPLRPLPHLGLAPRSRNRTHPETNRLHNSAVSSLAVDASRKGGELQTYRATALVPSHQPLFLLFCSSFPPFSSSSLFSLSTPPESFCSVSHHHGYF